MTSKQPDKKESTVSIPPHNLEAEAGLLGGILVDKEGLVRVADIVGSGDFYVDLTASFLTPCWICMRRVNRSTC